MEALEEAKNVFSIFHDGELSYFSGKLQQLMLKVDCQYLAERIDPTFVCFYVELHHVEKLAFDPWGEPIGTMGVVRFGLQEVFAKELEILSADVIGEVVSLQCNGGSLTFSCKGIKVFDQNRRALTSEALADICRDYWDDWSKK